MNSNNDTSLLIYGGTIHTMGRTDPVESLLIVDGRVQRCGTLRELRDEAPTGVRRLDLQGATAIPGLIDTHPHLLHFAARTDSFVDLSDAADHDDIEARIARRAREAKPGEWIFCTPVGEPYYFLRRSYRDLAERRLPDRKVLDRAAPDNPVYLQAWSPMTPNACAFNSRALAHLFIDATLPDRISDVWIDKDAAGEPTGILRGSVNTMFSLDPYWSQVYARIPSPELNPYATTRRAMREYNALGVTTVFEGHNMAPAHIDVYRRLHAEGHLTVRVLATLEIENYAVLPYKALSLAQFDGALETARALQLAGDEFFRIEGATLSDGGPCWSGHSFSYEPYMDPYGRETKGVRFMSPEKRRRFVSFCSKHGIRGNLCCGAPPDHDDFLDLFEDQGIRADKWIVQHAPVITAKQARRYRDLGFDLTTSMSFPWGMGDVYRDRIGKHILPDLVPLKRLVDVGIRVGCGTDWGPKNIFEHLLLAETHEFAGSGFRNNGPDQRIDRRTALEMFTSRAGEILSWLPVGHLEPGAMADVTVVDRDVLTCAAEDLPATVVRQTLVGGKTVYESGEAG